MTENNEKTKEQLLAERAVGVSLTGSYGSSQIVIQTHFSREEDPSEYLKKYWKILDKRKAECELPEIQDALRKQNLMVGDFSRQKEVQIEDVHFTIQKQIREKELELEKLVLTRRQLMDSANKRTSNKRDDDRYVPPEKVQIDNINIDVKVIENAIADLKAELANPDEKREGMRNLKQIKLQIDRSTTEIGRLEKEIKIRQDLINGNDVCSDS